MSGHLVTMAGYIPEGMHPCGLKFTQAHRLALMKFCDSADDQNRLGFPGYEAVRIWAGVKGARSSKVVQDLQAMGLIMRVRPAFSGQRAVYKVFPEPGDEHSYKPDTAKIAKGISDDCPGVAWFAGLTPIPAGKDPKTFIKAIDDAKTPEAEAALIAAWWVKAGRAAKQDVLADGSTPADPSGMGPAQQTHSDGSVDGSAGVDPSGTNGSTPADPSEPNGSTKNANGSTGVDPFCPSPSTPPSVLRTEGGTGTDDADVSQSGFGPPAPPLRILQGGMADSAAEGPSGDQGTQTGQKGGPKQRTRIPPGFEPSARDLEWAREHVPGLDLAESTKTFVEYWTKVRGEKADWSKTWRNRMKADHEFQARRGALGPELTPEQDGVAEGVIAEWWNRWQSRPLLDGTRADLRGIVRKLIGQGMSGEQVLSVLERADVAVPKVWQIQGVLDGTWPRNRRRSSPEPGNRFVDRDRTSPEAQQQAAVRRAAFEGRPDPRAQQDSGGDDLPTAATDRGWKW